MVGLVTDLLPSDPLGEKETTVMLCLQSQVYKLHFSTRVVIYQHHLQVTLLRNRGDIAVFLQQTASGTPLSAA